MEKKPTLKKGAPSKVSAYAGIKNVLLTPEAQPSFGADPVLSLKFADYLGRKSLQPRKDEPPKDHRTRQAGSVMKRFDKELVDYLAARKGTEGKVLHRVHSTYPEARIGDFDMIPVWKSLLEKTDWFLHIDVDSPESFEAIEKFCGENSSRIAIGVTISMTAKGEWDEKGIKQLVQYQEGTINTYPKLVPTVSPRDWNLSLEKLLDELGTEKCESVWAETHLLANKDEEAKEFYNALQAQLSNKKFVFFQHEPSSHDQRVEWERCIIPTDRWDAFAFYFGVEDESIKKDQADIKQLLSRLDNKNKAEMEAIHAMYDLSVRIAPEDADERVRKQKDRVFRRMCEVVWEYGKSQVGRHLKAGKFLYRLRADHPDLPFPQCEYHTRDICDLPEANQVEAWKEACERSAGPPVDRKSLLVHLEDYVKRNKIEVKRGKEASETSAENATKKLILQIKKINQALQEKFPQGSEIAKASSHLLCLIETQVSREVSQAKGATAEPTEAVRPEAPSSTDSNNESKQSLNILDDLEYNPCEFEPILPAGESSTSKPEIEPPDQT